MGPVSVLDHSLLVLNIFKKDQFKGCLFSLFKNFIICLFVYCLPAFCLPALQERAQGQSTDFIRTNELIFGRAKATRQYSKLLFFLQQ